MNNIFIKNGVLVDISPSFQFSSLYSELSHGVYTISRSFGPLSLFNFPTQVNRIYSGIRKFQSTNLFNPKLDISKPQVHDWLFSKFKHAAMCFAKQSKENFAFKLSIIVTPSEIATTQTDYINLDPLLEYFIHVQPFTPIEDESVSVLIGAPPRHDAETKNCSWVAIREAYVKAIPSSFNEVILVETDNPAKPPHLCLEGMGSNFFILGKDGKTFYTAPADGGILKGSMRMVVLDILNSKNTPFQIVEKSPSLLDIENWNGAFLTSTSRQILPISKIVVLKKTLPSLTSNDFDFSEGSDTAKTSTLNTSSNEQSFANFSFPTLTKENSQIFNFESIHPSIVKLRLLLKSKLPEYSIKL